MNQNFGPVPASTKPDYHPIAILGQVAIEVKVNLLEIFDKPPPFNYHIPLTTKQKMISTLSCQVVKPLSKHFLYGISYLEKGIHYPGSNQVLDDRNLRCSFFVDKLRGKSLLDKQ